MWRACHRQCVRKWQSLGSRLPASNLGMLRQSCFRGPLTWRLVAYLYLMQHHRVKKRRCCSSFCQHISQYHEDWKYRCASVRLNSVLRTSEKYHGSGADAQFCLVALYKGSCFEISRNREDDCAVGCSGRAVDVAWSRLPIEGYCVRSDFKFL